MKRFYTTLLLCTIVSCCIAQLKLAGKDEKNLIALAELYSHNNMFTGAATAKAADSLRTPLLNHIVDVLIASGKPDTSMLQRRFLAKPTHDDLLMWYVIREIHYNRIDTTKKPLPDVDIVKNTLSKSIDDRWLLDNYYYRLYSALAMLFNTADLSHHDIKLDELGLQDDTEKGIFFLNMTEALLNGRLRVLQYMKNNDRIKMFCSKMPTFNGKQYYYYTNLNFADFDWIGYNKTESYKKRHVGNLISVLLVQFISNGETGNKDTAREIYFSSILHQPDYFKYSTSQKDLQKLYEQSK